MGQFLNRIIRALALHKGLYEEVEADSGALIQAAAVVILSSLATGVGVFGGSIVEMIIGAVGALVSWLIWAGTTYFIGTRLLPSRRTRSSLGELLRTTGFATAPGLLRVFGWIPWLWGVIFILTSIWMLAAFVLAVRQALDYESTARALGVCALGFLFYLFLMILLDQFRVY